MHPSRFASTWAYLIAASLAAASTSAQATVLLSDNFDGGTSNNVPTGWKDVVNYTTANTAAANTVQGAIIANSGGGSPIVDHTSGTGKYATFLSSAAGVSGSTYDGWLISPALAINGNEATVSFYYFAARDTVRLQVLLSTNGTNNVPNYGAEFTSGAPTTTAASNTYDNNKTKYAGVQAGDFTTSLLDVNPTHAGTAVSTYPSPGWIQYTLTIPANLVSGTGYIAFRQSGTNAPAPSQVFQEGFDDFTVTVPEPAALTSLAAVTLLSLRRRRQSSR